MSAHASQAFSIAHCTDSEDLPEVFWAGELGKRGNELSDCATNEKSISSIIKEL